MRILYVSGARIPSEKAHSLQTLQTTAAMCRIGHDVELWTPFRFRERDANGHSTMGVPLRVLTAPDLLPIERLLPAALRVPAFALQSSVYGAIAAAKARREHPDLCFTREWLIADWLDRLGLPYILEEHRSHVERPRARARIAAMAGGDRMRRLAVVTHGLADAYRAAGAPASKVAIVPDAVDVEAFGRETPTQEARRRFDLPADGPIVGYVGRFQTMNAEKGILETVAAAAAVPTTAHYVFVGGPMELVPSYLEAIRTRGLEPARFRFRDRVPHEGVPALLRGFDLCVMPFPDTHHYRHDMSPLKMFEYMAAGRAIVATDLPSVREVLVDGESALLVPPGDANALGGAIARLLADDQLRARLGARAQAESRRYSWDARARALLDGVASA